MHRELNFSIKKLISAIITLFFCGSFAYFLICYANAAISSIINGITSCLTVVIPALFSFMVLSTFLLESGLYQILSLPFYPLSKYIFRIEPSLFSIFILSQIGGYPIGVKLISELVISGKITKKEADNMLCYCFCSGPSFIIGVISLRLYNSMRIGIIIFASIALTNIIVAIFIGFFTKPARLQKNTIKLNISSTSLISSINSSTKALISVCSMIVVFGVAITMLDTFNIIPAISNSIGNLFSSNANVASKFIKGFIEISSLSQIDGTYISIPLVTGLISFGGICVIMQVSAIGKGALNLKKFLLIRPIAALLSAILCRYLLSLYSPSIFTWKGAVRQTVENPSSPFPSIILLLMTFFLLSSKGIEKSGRI
mgnify:FL=1